MGGTGSVIVVVDVIIGNVDCCSAEEGCLIERERKIGSESGAVVVGSSSCEIALDVKKDDCRGAGGEEEDKGRLEKAFGGKEDECGGEMLPATDELREEDGVIVVVVVLMDEDG